MREISPMPWDYRLQLEARNGVSQPGTLFTRDAFESIGGIDESYRYAMDYELWLKLGARFDVRCIERPLAGFRVHPASKSVAESAGFRSETWRAARSHGARLRSPLFLDYYLPAEHPWAFRLLIAWRHVKRGEIRKLAARAAAHLRAEVAVISIVTPSLNQGRFIAAALDSVATQPVQVEHVVLDGGSTDDTVAILELTATASLHGGPGRTMGSTTRSTRASSSRPARSWAGSMRMTSTSARAVGGRGRVRPAS